ncbi:hypothetical protein ACB371_25265, partial [Klebsiella pneumoniae]
FMFLFIWFVPVVKNLVFNQSNRDAFSGFRIYRETLSRFSCAASGGQRTSPKMPAGPSRRIIFI